MPSVRSSSAAPPEINLSNRPSSQSLVFGIVPQDVFSDLQTASEHDWRSKADSMTSLQQVILKCDEFTLSGANLPAAVDFLAPFLLEQNFKVSLTALQIVSDLALRSPKSILLTSLDNLIAALTPPLADRKLLLRQSIFRTFSAVMNILSPETVLEPLTSMVSRADAKSREDVLNLVILCLLALQDSKSPAASENSAKFSSTSPNPRYLKPVISSLLPALCDPMPRVTYVAGEAIAVLAAQYGQKTILDVIAAYDVDPRTMDALKLRFQNSMLPVRGVDGVIIHIVNLRATSSSQVRKSSSASNSLTPSKNGVLDFFQDSSSKREILPPPLLEWSIRDSIPANSQSYINAPYRKPASSASATTTVPSPYLTLSAAVAALPYTVRSFSSPTPSVRDQQFSTLPPSPETEAKYTILAEVEENSNEELLSKSFESTLKPLSSPSESIKRAPRDRVKILPAHPQSIIQTPENASPKMAPQAPEQRERRKRVDDTLSTIPSSQQLSIVDSASPVFMQSERKSASSGRRSGSNRSRTISETNSSGFQGTPRRMTEAKAKISLSSAHEILVNDKADWEEKIKAMEAIIEHSAPQVSEIGSSHAPPNLDLGLLNSDESLLNELTFAVIPQVGSLRSTVARAALTALETLLAAQATRRQTDLDSALIEPILTCLFKKVSDQNSFLSDTISRGFMAFSAVGWPFSRLMPVVLTWTSHKHPPTRSRAADLLVSTLAKLPETAIVKYASSMFEQQRLIPCLINLLRDGNSTIRAQARKALTILYPIGEWRAVLAKLASSSQMADIQKALEAK